jgi:hypothetical protein
MEVRLYRLSRFRCYRRCREKPKAVKDFLWQLLAQVLGFYIVAYVHITIWKIAYRHGMRARGDKPKDDPPIPGISP